MKLVRIAVVLLLVTLLPSLAQSRTWYVKVDGTGDAPTIAAGVDSAAAGDTVLVASGTYTWTNQGGSGPWGMITMKSGVTLLSESGPQATILDGERNGRLVLCYNVAGPASIEGFTITRGFSEYVIGVGGGGINCENSSVLIRDNIVTDNIGGGDVAPGGGGIHCDDSPGTVVTNNVITDNLTSSRGGGILVAGNAPEITNNLISDNTAEDEGGGICCLHMDGVIEHNLIVGNTAQLGGAVYCHVTTGEISNNTILGNSAPSGAAIYFASSSSPTVTANIVAGSQSGPALDCDGTSSPTVTCNDLWNNAGGDGSCILGADNFSADPAFCDSLAGDYHLYENSQCAPDNSPAGCGLIGALPIRCWGTPLSPVGIILIIVGTGAIGSWRALKTRAGRRNG